jgi:hypothetical protein
MLVKKEGYLILKEWAVVDNCALPLRLLLLSTQENFYKSSSEQGEQSLFIKLPLTARKNVIRRIIRLAEHLGSLEINNLHTSSSISGALISKISEIK